MSREYTDKQLDAIGAGLKAGEPVEKVLASLPPGKAKKPRNNEESRAQRAVFDWWDRVSMLKFGLHRCLMHSVPNGGFRSIVTASIMKAEGQRPGVFDIKLNVARGSYHGAWIEMKATKGKLSDHQIEFMDHVRSQGYFAKTCWSAQDAVAAITGYLTLWPNPNLF